MHQRPLSAVACSSLLLLKCVRTDDVIAFKGFEYPGHDITPDEYLFGSYLLNKTIVPNKLKWRCNATTSMTKDTVACNPPEYNSMGFLLLGYVLAAHYNASTWDSFDYKQAVRKQGHPSIRPSLRQPSTCLYPP